MSHVFASLVAIPSFLLGPLVNLVLPMVIGTVSSVAYQYVKKASDWVDGLPAQSHAFVVGALAIVLPVVSKLVPGLSVPDSLGGFDATAVQALVAFAATQLTHKVLSKPQA